MLLSICFIAVHASLSQKKALGVKTNVKKLKVFFYLMVMMHAAEIASEGAQQIWHLKAYAKNTSSLPGYDYLSITAIERLFYC